MINLTAVEPGILSPQQKLIYDLISKGLKAKEVAKELNIACETVKKQIRRIKEKQKKTREKTLNDALNENELLQLSGRQQQIEYIRRNGYKIKDAAKILGISASTARQYNFRAKTIKIKINHP